MTRQNVFVIFGLVCLVLLFLLLYNYDSTDSLAQDAERLQNVAQPLDSVNAWWTAAALCLNDDATLPGRLRVFVGGSLPTSWKKTWDRGTLHGGYAIRGKLIWLEAFTRPRVTHELWHLKHGDAHAAAVFGADGKSPRCGLAPA